MAAFDVAFAFTLSEEGGAVNNPDDPGGFTFRGVTLASFREWRCDPSAMPENLLSISDDELAAFYGVRYWNPLRGDDLPPAVALMAFDFGVNAGVGRSARLLQGSVGAIQDGSIGPQTLGAVRVTDSGVLVDDLATAQATYYRTLPTFTTFGRGWLARTERRAHAARALLSPTT
jgi:lysozyme family protein